MTHPRRQFDADRRNTQLSIIEIPQVLARGGVMPETDRILALGWKSIAPREMMPMMVNREYLRRSVNWLTLAGTLLAGIFIIYNLFAFRHNHHKLTVWFEVGMVLLVVSQLTAIAARRKTPK